MRYDDDGSGEIDATELGQIMASLGKPMEAEAVSAMINEIDDSGDALIDFDEFVGLIKGGDTLSFRGEVHACVFVHRSTHSWAADLLTTAWVRLCFHK
eukprot:SAG11_NODE_1196_length_5545_cov_17.791407_2_plen_98_part_00